MTEGVAQAKAYAEKMQIRFTFSTNGQDIYGILRLKYHDSLPDAVADLGAPKQIQEVFIGFQKLLYISAA